jgi:membrane-associated phospholipid phosphatase
MEHRPKRLLKFLRARLSPEGFLGLYLTLGILVLLAASWLFGAIAEDVVTSDPINVVDARLNAWFQVHANPNLTAFLLIVTRLHGTIGIFLATAVIGAYWWRRRLGIWTLTLILTVYGGTLLNLLLKNIFLRPRPYFRHPVLTLTGYGFPSGHTMMATVFYGTLCVFAVSRTVSWKSRGLAVAMTILMIALVGFSRIYLGAHYLSDVLGAITEGLAWLALCLTAVHLWRGK